MAEHNEDGRERQERIKQEQHRPEQNKGYDEAARGGPRMPKTDVGIPHDQPQGGE